MAKRTKEQDRWHKRGFAAGIAVACSTIFDVWGEDVQCQEVMRAAGLDTRAKMKALGVDDYDLKILGPVFKTIGERRVSQLKRRQLAETGKAGDRGE